MRKRPTGTGEGWSGVSSAMRFRLLPILLWFLLLAWLLLQVVFFMSLAERDQSPIDYLPYQRAAEAIERSKSPYLAPEQSREIFRYFHQIETELLAANARGEGRAFLNDLAARPQQARSLRISAHPGPSGRPAEHRPPGVHWLAAAFHPGICSTLV
jgi:hypothetical protein